MGKTGQGNGSSALGGNSTRLTGIIARKVVDRGFGFITGPQGKQFFFHMTALPAGMRFDDVRDGQAVTFVPQESDKGPRAEHLELV